MIEQSLHISGMAEFLSLSVFENCTLNFSSFLMSIGCDFLFKGNILFIFSFSRHFLANLRLKYSLLFSSVSIFSTSKAFLWFSYLDPRIILKADFCTPSKSDY